MPTEKKKKKEIIKELELEVQQLRAALKTSRDYADKLVEHIPYLPKDIEVLREANLELAKDNDKLQKSSASLNRLLQPALNIASEFMDPGEFPGPYTLETRNGKNLFMREWAIRAKTDEIVLETNYKPFANFCVEILNSIDRKIYSGE
jgi:hypothetical protein